ncbi:MAG: hypothetical protein GWN98_08560 [Gammaproteobacteria bacterium]|nr:hypothetical protein [Gammaproteobacteria bacterium]NIS05036.1 hypothetical protein [Gammaproteobacteria bacterium]NIT93080.1 hypothetical protein [Gammaproteobacteria bacterium]
MTSSGCEAMFGQREDASATATRPGADRARTSAEDDAREVAAHVNFMNVLDSTDAQAWQTIFEHTHELYQQDATPERRLRLAIVLSRADRMSAGERITTDRLGEARDMLAETLADPAPIPPLVRKFARLQLSELETRLALYEEMRSLRAQLAKAHQENQSAQRDRSEVEARMRRIDAALTEANAKLEAVMDIERNITSPGKETFP